MKYFAFHLSNKQKHYNSFVIRKNIVLFVRDKKWTQHRDISRICFEKIYGDHYSWWNHMVVLVFVFMIPSHFSALNKNWIFIMQNWWQIYIACPLWRYTLLIIHDSKCDRTLINNTFCARMGNFSLFNIWCRAIYYIDGGGGNGMQRLYTFAWFGFQILFWTSNFKSKQTLFPRNWKQNSYRIIIFGQLSHIYSLKFILFSTNKSHLTQ